READGSIVWYGIILDITEQKQAEEEFRLHSRVLENMSEGVILVSLTDTKIVYTNHAADQMFGYQPGELIGQNASIVNAPGALSPEERANEIALLVAKNKLYQGEIQNRKKDGTLIWCSVTVSNFSHPVYGDVGVTIQKDITERKQAEEDLKESEQRFSKAFYTSPVSQSIITSESNEIIEVNDACCRLFGYDREELIGASTTKLNLWNDPADRASAVKELRNTGHLLPREATIRTKSGKTSTAIAAIEPISWKGAPCLISFLIDISERKQAEEQLHRNEEVLRLFVEHSPA
ncbi:MAG: PAS domain S-box protein, partial [Anaerolineales bacterium]|nr:PAS domain S-box protein [Anaerolineales bacterium]